MLVQGPQLVRLLHQVATLLNSLHTNSMCVANLCAETIMVEMEQVRSDHGLIHRDILDCDYIRLFIFLKVTLIDCIVPAIGLYVSILYGLHGVHQSSLHIVVLCRHTLKSVL